MLFSGTAQKATPLRRGLVQHTVRGWYFQQMNKNAKSYIVILWNINQTPDNPYTYPQIRIGFTVAI